MPTNGTSTKSTETNTTGTTTESTTVLEGLSKAREDTAARVRQTTERAVDLPVGVALTAADRVTEIVEPWTSTTTRDKELKSIRQRVVRELSKFERRGGTARRKAATRVRQSRNRVERELKARRRKVQTTVKKNRTRAQDGLKKAQSAVQERVTTLV